jgi:hypothetical protein
MPQNQMMIPNNVSCCITANKWRKNASTQKQKRKRSNIMKGPMHLLSLFFLDYFCLFD